MKYKFIFFLVLITTLPSFSQKNDIRERVYLHINNPLLLSGETLFYGAYVRSDLTGAPSLVSTILYVELVDEKEVRFQQKIKITEGKGSGRFFVPSLLPTGRYYLIAYTRWMKNFGDFNAFPIDIVNPFEKLKIDTLSADKPTLEFYPVTKNMASGTQNKIGFKITAPNLEKRKFSGRLQNSQGETLVNFSPDYAGHGQFSFTPSENDTYQVILEEEGGGFHFFPFNKTSSITATFNIEETPKGYAIHTSGNETKQDLEIAIANAQEEYIRQAVPTSGTLEITHNQLSRGLNQALLLNHLGDTLGKQILFVQENITSNSILLKGITETRNKIELQSVVPAGNYSVSVVKKYNHIETRHYSSAHYRLNNYDGQNIAVSSNKEDQLKKNIETYLLSSGNIRFNNAREVSKLPEMKRESLSGQLLLNTGEPVINETVTLTLSGNSFQFRTAKTDSMGRFVFFFDSADKLTKAYIATHTAREDVVFNMDEKWMGVPEGLKFPTIVLDTVQINEIAKRSVQVQIQNAYADIPEEPEWYNPIPEFAPYSFSFLLDDYNRFPTMADHFIEYIPTIGIRKGDIKFFVKYVFKDVEFPGLVLLDGVPVDSKKILEFNPFKIEKIELINNRYFHGALSADGVVSLTSFDGNMSDYPTGNSVLKFDLLPLLTETQFNSPQYDKMKQERIPDQRTQLLWAMKEVQGDENLTAEFYTSDITGTYEIIIEGFTKDGTPVSSRKTFEVK